MTARPRNARQCSRPDFSLEIEQGAERGRIVVGLDEAGRGPWAGPVVAAAVWLVPERLPAAFLDRLNDSKTLAPETRAALYEQMVESAAGDPAPALRFGLGSAEVAEIDRLNILQASLLAMARALAALPLEADVALVDGTQVPALPCPAFPVVKGDARSLSIAAASIFAKVARDREMEALARRHPGYGWERNRGYGTAEHRAALARLGVTQEHRRSFRPVRETLSLSR